MRTPQLLCGACAVVAVLTSACNRPATREDAQQAAREAKDVAARAGNQLADSWLTTKIQTQYFADDDVKARQISVSTRDGIVTLRGRVDSENEHQQAVQIASTTDGVKQVVDQLTVGSGSDIARGTQPDSLSIVTRVQAQYFSDPHVRGRDITVSTNNGVVTLTGRVESATEKQRAVDIARNTQGVTGVDAQLTVQPSTPPNAVATTGTLAEKTPADDTRLTADIQSKYFVDEMVKGRRIEVDVRQGVATLRGEVASESERAQALRLARTTDGVQRVEDSLTVNASLGSAPPPPTAANTAGAKPNASAQSDDAALTSTLRSKLVESINVSTKDGVVLLEGTVPNQAAKQRALSIAKQTKGVTQVVDRLSVGKKQ